MRDGRYAMRLTVGAFSQAGWLEVDQNRVRGGDGVYEITGSITGTELWTRAHLNIKIDPGAVKKARVPSEFSFEAMGSYTEKSFSLIGTGPLGVIVEVSGGS